eukprot:8457878-Pyramimonas_sp.AAC.1
MNGRMPFKYSEPPKSCHFVLSGRVDELAPAVNRQPGHHREPRRALNNRKSAEHRKEGLLEAFLEKEKTCFFMST